MSWQRFAPKQWTKAHVRLMRRLAEESIPFVTEYMVSGFHVDFLVSPSLVIEVDGDSHKRESRRRKDAWKDCMLRRDGYEVLRFSDDRVNADLDGVVEEIKEAQK